jgi:signal recognition particle subunit SRP54
LANQINASVFQKGTEANPRAIAREGLAYAKENGFDTVIVDTAGRQVIDENLMKELKDVKFVCQPDEVRFRLPRIFVLLYKRFLRFFSCV